MTSYRVMGMSTSATAGIGPAIIEAGSVDEAKDLFVTSEGTTLPKMEAAGIVVMAEEVAPAE